MKNLTNTIMLTLLMVGCDIRAASVPPVYLISRNPQVVDSSGLLHAANLAFLRHLVADAKEYLTRVNPASETRRNEINATERVIADLKKGEQIPGWSGITIIIEQDAWFAIIYLEKEKRSPSFSCYLSKDSMIEVSPSPKERLKIGDVTEFLSEPPMPTKAR